VLLAEQLAHQRSVRPGPLVLGTAPLKSPARAADRITEGGAYVGKSAFMPSWKSTLSEQDIADVIAFIRTLPVE